MPEKSSRELGVLEIKEIKGLSTSSVKWQNQKYIQRIKGAFNLRSLSTSFVNQKYIQRIKGALKSRS